MTQKRALLGGMLWGLLLAGPPGLPRLHLLELLFLLAPLVVVPLGLEAVATPDRRGAHSLPYRLAVGLQPAAALLLVISFYFSPGAVAATLALPWVLVTLLMAFHGLWRLLPRGFFATEEVALDLGLIFIAVGGGWLLLSRAGIGPLGFAEPIVLLTAVHFHFAGFAAPFITGLTGRVVLAAAPWRAKAYRLIVITVLASMPVVAAGLTFDSTVLEMAGALLFTAGLVGLAILMVRHVLPLARTPVVKGLLIVAIGSVLASMLLACIYAGGRLIDNPIIGISGMARTHGILNVFGFSLSGLLALVVLRPRARVNPPGIPFSRLRSGGRVGADFFERSGVVPPGQTPPRGLVESLGAYPLVHPTVRAFFEESERFTLAVRPSWAPGFRLGGLLWSLIALRLGQLLLPVTPTETQIRCHLLPLDEAQDGRPGVRGSVRVAAATGHVHQVAAYAVQGDDHARYMSTAFPLPGGNLTSIHRIESLPLPGSPAQGLVLTTRSSEQALGDEGVWFANAWLPIRLPVNDRITLWPAPDDEAAPVLAHHELWLFGFRFLTLQYRILYAEDGEGAAHLSE